MAVKVIEDRGSYYPPNAPDERTFQIADFAKPGDDPSKATYKRMYTGDAFRVAVYNMQPGQGQEPHLHPETTHAWFVVSGTGEMTLEDEKTEIVRAGTFCVHPKTSVHGIRNVGTDEFVYVVLSVGK
jgi:mannose-6-phosphate isomerase-like protein (cupin superfamily)